MATVTITIETTNDAFNDGAHGAFEVARILGELADTVRSDGTICQRSLWDSNGNRVGAMSIEDYCSFAEVKDGQEFFFNGKLWTKTDANTGESPTSIKQFDAEETVRLK